MRYNYRDYNRMIYYYEFCLCILYSTVLDFILIQTLSPPDARTYSDLLRVLSSLSCSRLTTA